MLKLSVFVRRIFIIALPLLALSGAAVFQSGWLKRASAEQTLLPATALPAESPAENPFGAGGVYFEANRGQHDARVKFMTRGAGATLFLTATEAVYVMRNAERRMRNEEKPAVSIPHSALRNRNAPSRFI